MNWDALGAVAELIGALGVICSLAYLAVQIRQNTRQVRGAVYDSIVTSLSGFERPIAQDPELARIFEQAIDDWDSIDHIERARVMHLLSTLFKQFENVYYQYRQENLEPELWAGWRHLMLSYHSREGVRDWWAMRSDFYSASFRHFLETTEVDHPMLSPRELAFRHGLEPRLSRS